MLDPNEICRTGSICPLHANMNAVACSAAFDTLGSKMADRTRSLIALVDSILSIVETRQTAVRHKH